MAFLISSGFAEFLKDPGGLWEFLILNIFSFIGNYGWRILLFTVLLKVVMVPLDIFQRYKMRKNEIITKRMKPQLEKLQQQFGANKQVLSQKTMELNKKEGFSYFSSCLPMIVTLVIFFYLFSGLNNISQYKNLKQYVGLYDAYNISETEFKNKNDGEYLKHVASEPADKNSNEYTIWVNKMARLDTDMSIQAKTAVVDYYELSGKESFLWVKNIWSPDVPWTKPILSASAFKTAIAKYSGYEYAAKKLSIDGEKLSKAQFDKMIGDYDKVTDYLAKSDTNKVNGLLILPILSIGLSFLSQFITSRLQKKSGQAGPAGSMGTSMKMMMFIMPLMMGFFALQYTSAFTLYIVVNSGMTILINVFTNLAMKNMDRRTSKDNPDVVHQYGRPDPNAPKTVKPIKVKKSDIEVVKKPNREPSEIEIEKSGKKKSATPESTDVFKKYNRPSTPTHPDTSKGKDKNKK